MVNPAADLTIPSAILDALPSMSAHEAVCTFILAAATYGKQRQHARLTYDDFRERSMLSSNDSITRALALVLKRGFFRRYSRSTWEVVESEARRSRPVESEPVEKASAASAAGERPTQLPAAGPSTALAVGSEAEESAPISKINAAESANDAPSTAVTAPVGAVTAPVDGVTAPVDGVTAPVGGVTAPVGGVTAPEGGVNAPAPAQPAASGSTKTVPTAAGNGTKTVPLPYRKEIDPFPGDLERERKKTQVDHEAAAVSRASPPLSQIPRPRTPEEETLAAHPATRTWLESGLAWPGWVRLRAITRRLGYSPQPDLLQRAYEMWLMHGYRANNTQGILDWYHSLCQDDQWQPYQESRPPAGRKQNAVSKRQEVFDMLMQMHKEEQNEQIDDSWLPSHAAGCLSTHGPRTEQHPHLSSGS